MSTVSRPLLLLLGAQSALFQDREGESSILLFQQQRRSELVETGLAQRLQNENKMKLEMILEMQLQPDLVQVKEATDVGELGFTVHSPGRGTASFT